MAKRRSGRAWQHLDPSDGQGPACALGWDLIVGFDHPEARLGGDPARGRLQLLLRDGSAVDLPMVREQAQLVDELSERLGPPRRDFDGARA